MPKQKTRNKIAEFDDNNYNQTRLNIQLCSLFKFARLVGFQVLHTEVAFGG